MRERDSAREGAAFNVGSNHGASVPHDSGKGRPGRVRGSRLVTTSPCSRKVRN